MQSLEKGRPVEAREAATQYRRAAAEVLAQFAENEFVKWIDQDRRVDGLIERGTFMEDVLHVVVRTQLRILAERARILLGIDDKQWREVRMDALKNPRYFDPDPVEVEGINR